MILNNAKFIVASGPVIIENNKVLLNRHGEDKKAQKYWKFVGGRVSEIDKIDENTLENVCKREVMEEMGIKIKIIKSLKPMMIQHPDKKNTYVILIHYLAKRIGEINPGKDIEEYKWWDINHLPKNCAPNIRPVIKEYKNQLIRN
jgi:ADP-ribose pyrophosphatase YjhB (NUDIX family)